MTLRTARGLSGDEDAQRTGKLPVEGQFPPRGDADRGRGFFGGSYCVAHPSEGTFYYMTTQQPVDIYARRSRKGDKQQRSTSGQAQVCRAVLAGRGLPAGEVHVDDGRSAWNPKVHRPGWDTLMARLESGQAGGVIVFDMERFSRKPIEGERLIAAAERGLLVLDSDAEFDLTTSSGKKSFRDAMNAAAYYSDRLSDRVRRGKRIKALSGEPHGKVSKERGPFGFMPDGETPHPEESVILGEVTARFLAGETQDSLLADLNERGITTATGGKWTRRSLHDVLVRPLNAGLIVHQGEVVARLGGTPVIDPEDHQRVVAMFAARRPGRPPSGAYLCSGSSACGLCGKPLGGRPRAHLAPYADGEVKREYWCTRTGYGGCGHISIDQRALDDHARKIAIKILSDTRQAAQIETAAARVREAADVLDRDISAAEDLALRLADRLGRGELTLERYDAAAAPLDRRLADLRQRRAELGDPGEAVPAAPMSVWIQRWDDADPGERRILLRAALGSRKLIVHPADPGDRANVALRVSVGMPGVEAGG